MEIFDTFEDNLSLEILKKINDGWNIIEESLCNYSLFLSPDNEKSCISCKLNESKNYLNHLDTQYNDLISNFKKLKTPSRIEFSRYFQSFSSLH